LVADPESTVWNKGFNVTRQVRDIVIGDAKVEGFIHPIVTSEKFKGKPDLTDMVFSNVVVDGRPLNPKLDIHKPLAEVISSYNPAFHLVVNYPNSNPAILGFVSTNKLKGDIPLSLAQEYIVSGVKTDSLGNKAFKSRWTTESLIGLIKIGYYTRPDGKKCILLSDYFADRLSGQTKINGTRLVLTKDYNILGPFLGKLPN
jgi:hypothetical protein